MFKVSVLILTKNEERNITACIQSVKSFADEVIVIDDYSDDATVQLALKLGAKVIQHGLEDNWGAQQTFAIQQANFDWIFFIDADERVTPKLAEVIKKVLVENNKDFAYRCARLSYFWGQPLKHGGWYPDYVTRLFPRFGSYVTGLVHPKICHNCIEKNFSQEAHLVHYPYRDWENYFNKLNLYTTLAAKKAHSQGKSVNFLDIILHPLWASFRMYFLRGGFLDGLIGFVLASFHYFYTMTKYVKLYYLDRNNSNSEEETNV